MRVLIKREGAVHYTASTGKHRIHLDGAPKFGGVDAGMRPMELFLSSLASCSAMDVTEILEDAGHQIETLTIAISGERAPTPPAFFTSITLVYRAKGTMSPDELFHACHVALEERCSVREMIRGNVEVTFDAVVEE